ncbi:hypothetical protein GCM10010277_35860 [Streptomyces longisporoflavus]|uniref:hypothetical protein n=1 Tax=Streptomyces longisporoflavus TaxID=28044 RepID=UPI00167F09C1|nr:hypothetical protein [Streptomyces longisporoflavus]GGV45197.1 hypothetical protein GCM10010277_35860 [Streptomyces longisporoflavus]
MFIDQSGLRKRTLQGMALVVGGACLGYLLFVGTLISGLLEPVGTQPPSTNAPAPAGPDTGASQRGSGTPARADAGGSQAGAPSRGGVRADRHDRRRPPAGRTAPPAGGRGQ